MFYGCSSLTTLDLSGFNTANVTEIWSMFSGCSSLTSLDLSNFNTENLTSFGELFNNCSSLTSINLSSFNTANVTSMQELFSGCSSLTSLDLSSFNTANLKNARYMFSGCSNLKTIYVGTGWTTAAVTESTNMFADCTALIGGEGTAYDATHTDYTYAHIDEGTTDTWVFDRHCCTTTLRNSQ